MTSITVRCDTVIEFARQRIDDVTADAEKLYQENIDRCLNLDNSGRRLFRRKPVTREQVIAEAEKNAPHGRGCLHIRNEHIETGSYRYRLLMRAAAACITTTMTLSVDDANYLKLPPAIATNRREFR